MSMQAFQQALVDLTLAPRQARALREGDASAFAALDLTHRERTRLLDVASQPGISVHCSLSRGNRLEVIFGSFPMTCVLLRTAPHGLLPNPHPNLLRNLLDELFDEYRPTNYQLAGEDSAFAELLRRKLATGALQIEYLDEIFAYELACAGLMHRRRSQAATHAPVETVFEFAHSPGDLLPPLSRLQPPPAGLPRGSYRTTVSYDGERFDVQPHQQR